jgi:hypothetical protein
VPRVEFFLGLDLGQANDATAISIVQPFQRPAKIQNWAPPTRYYGKRPLPPPDAVPPPLDFHLRNLQRLAKGPVTVPAQRDFLKLHGIKRVGEEGWPYPAQVDYVVALLNSPFLRGRVELVIDATGVGRPVVDLFRRAQQQGKFKANIIPVTITGGEKVHYQDGFWRVPKRDLVVALQVVLQEHRLRIAPDIELRKILTDEISAFKVKIDPLTAQDSYGAVGRVGAHDDIVLSVALANWDCARSCGVDLSIGSMPPNKNLRRFATATQLDEEFPKN